MGGSWRSVRRHSRSRSWDLNDVVLEVFADRFFRLNGRESVAVIEVVRINRLPACSPLANEYWKAGNCCPWIVEIGRSAAGERRVQDEADRQLAHRPGHGFIGIGPERRLKLSPAACHCRADNSRLATAAQTSVIGRPCNRGTASTPCSLRMKNVEIGLFGEKSLSVRSEVAGRRAARDRSPTDVCKRSRRQAVQDRRGVSAAACRRRAATSTTCGRLSPPLLTWSSNSDSRL